MIGTIQLVYCNNLSSGAFTLAGAGPFPWGATPVAVQTGLVGVYGAGNVVVCSEKIGVWKSQIPQTSVTGYYSVMFIGDLWGTNVPDMVIGNSTNGAISIIYKPIMDRLYSHFQRIVDIYVPIDNAQLNFGDPEAADDIPLYKANYTGIPAGYEPTPNYSSPRGEQLQKLSNIMTADRFIFLSDMDIADRYMIVDRTPGSILQDQPWIVQGNPFVNESLVGRPVEIKYVYGVLGPTDMIPGVY